MPRHGRTAILADGDLPSLIALAAAAESQVSLGDDDYAEVVLLADGRYLGRNAVACVRQQADRIGLATVSEAPVLITHQANGNVSEATDVLVKAAASAVRMGCRRLVWPVAVPASCDRQLGVSDTSLDADPESDHMPNPIEERAILDGIGAAMDRALLVGRLISLDASELQQPDLQILTPYIDLSADQIADLALDLDAPIDACWWGGEHASLNHTAAETTARWWTARLESFGWSLPVDINIQSQRQAQMRAERLA